MTITPQQVPASTGQDGSWRRTPETGLAASARDHLWMHFTRHSTYEQGGSVPIITRGQGAYIWDDLGRRYLDGLSGLFVVQAGHGRPELARAAAEQASELAFFPLWSYAHPQAIQLAERLAALAPGDLNRVFFTTGGGEAVESAWKLAKQFFKLTGKPMKHKVISRAVAYHGPPRAPCPSPASPTRRSTSSRWSPAPTRPPTPTSTGPLSTAATSRRSVAGPPTRSRSPSRWRARTPSRPCS